MRKYAGLVLIELDDSPYVATGIRCNIFQLNLVVLIKDILINNMRTKIENTYGLLLNY